jgi:hypothetical protein
VARSTIADLARLLPPPEKPLDYNEAMLARNQGVFRIQFPDDFVEFGRAYGSGTIKAAYSWEVWSPFRPTYPLIVLEFARVWNLFKDAADVSGVPFGIFPEVGGLLPFAKSADGDWVCFRTAGEPNGWDVVDLGRYEPGGYEILEGGFADYFVSVLSRRVVLKRHANGNGWDPQTDLKFRQRVFADQGL